MARVTYAVAWRCEPGPRLVGSATVDGDRLVLLGREPGVRDEERLALVTGDAGHVELHRSSALPSILAQHEGRPVVIELLFGGWGAAHQLADTLARPIAPAPVTPA